MPRFFVDKEKINEGYITLSGEDARHISYSLRMAVGDSLTVCDGNEREYLCTLTKLDGETVMAEIKEERTGEGEMPISVHLFQAFPKGDKLELIIQKAVELGASSVIPFESERCVKRPKADKIDKQVQRMQRIADEASKQCGRARLSSIECPVSFSEMLGRVSGYDLALFCYEGCDTDTIKDALEKRGKGISSLCIIVGSEGGFSPAEAKAIEEAGAISVTLGKRILRCETAPLYALSCVSFYYEM